MGVIAGVVASRQPSAMLDKCWQPREGLEGIKSQRSARTPLACGTVMMMALLPRSSGGSASMLSTVRTRMTWCAPN